MFKNFILQQEYNKYSSDELLTQNITQPKLAALAYNYTLTQESYQYSQLL